MRKSSEQMEKLVWITNKSNTYHPKVSLEEGSLHENLITESDTFVATTDGNLGSRPE